jgi:hypothetical protein
MSDDKEPSVQSCVDRSRQTRSGTATKNAKKMDCAQLADKINELIDKEKQGRAGTKGLKQRHRDYVGDDVTHGDHYSQQQASLNSYLDEYINKGCGDPPGHALEWAVKPLPSPKSTTTTDAAKAVAVTGGAVGLAYIAYRIVRLIPSLAFPPSLIPNLAIP